MLDQTPALRLSILLHRQAIAIQSQRKRRRISTPPARFVTETRPMNTVTLRPWHPSDIEACMTIWRAGSEQGHPFLSRAELDADAILVRNVYMPATDITVAEQAGEILGFIALSENFIGALFVAPERHRQGLGRMLLADAARKHPLLDVEVYAANSTARRFYATSGFIETLCHLNDDQGRPHPLIRMQCDAVARPAPVQTAA